MTKKGIRPHWEEHQEYSLQGHAQLVINVEYNLGLVAALIFCWIM